MYRRVPDRERHFGEMANLLPSRGSALWLPNQGGSAQPKQDSQPPNRELENELPVRARICLIGRFLSCLGVLHPMKSLVLVDGLACTIFLIILLIC